MYVIRDAVGNILGWSDVMTERATELIPDNDPALLAEISRREQDAAKSNANVSILAQLASNDLKIIRALVEGDAIRISEHAAKQSILRTKLVE